MVVLNCSRVTMPLIAVSAMVPVIVAGAMIAARDSEAIAPNTVEATVSPPSPAR
jgi:hypothetical protein